MKNILLIILVFTTSFIFAQNTTTNPQDIGKKHEIKINTFNLIKEKIIDLSYERLLNENSSVGISFLFGTDKKEDNLSYAFKPFYRRYFSKKYARGFFVEGFGSLKHTKASNYFPNNNGTSFSFGVGLGVKLVSKKNISAEAMLGIGRELGNKINAGNLSFPGFSIGFRF